MKRSRRKIILRKRKIPDIKITPIYNRTIEGDDRKDKRKYVFGGLAMCFNEFEDVILPAIERGNFEYVDIWSNHWIIAYKLYLMNSDVYPNEVMENFPFMMMSLREIVEIPKTGDITKSEKTKYINSCITRASLFQGKMELFMQGNEDYDAVRRIN